MLATAIVGGMSYLRRYSAFAISLKAEAELRRRLFDHLQRLHFGYHDRAQIGELMARVSTDAKQVQLLLVFIPIFGANIVMIVGVSIVLFALNAQLAAAALASLPLLFLGAWRFSSLLHPVAMGLQQRLAGGLARGRGEPLRHPGREGLRCRGSPESAQLGDAADGVYDRGMALARLRAAFNPLLEVLPTSVSSRCCGSAASR